MGLPKKCDARDCLSAGRSTSHNSFRPAGQADRTNSSGIGPDETRAKRLTFAEDFMLEHSQPGLHITLTGISASAGTAPRKPQQSAQCLGVPS
jgi:hypothetical protein